MKRLLPAVLCATTLSIGLSCAYAQEADAPKDVTPQPDPVTQDWSFDFEYTTPDTIAIENADGSISWYWYMTYKVTNFEEEELFFDPRIVIQSDNGDIVTANLGIDISVFKEVRTLLQNPLLQSPLEVPGRVFNGENYTKQSAIIWEVSEDDIDNFNVFVGGIYGERKTVTDPNTGKPIMVPVINALTGEEVKDESGNTVMEPLELKRTLKISYKTPGTNENRQDPEIQRTDEKD
ncbi:MAG: hypothetical protein AAF085_02635, partial [Planctomycetota bacterium]